MSFEEKLRWLSVSINAGELADLKCQFEAVINSKRKYSQITTFIDLIGVLIARGIVSSDNVSVLDQISHHYLGRDFSKILEPKESVSLLNAPQTELGQTFYFKPNGEVRGTEATGVRKACSPELVEKRVPAVPEEVVEHIARELYENQWRRFVRNLKVGEQYVVDETRISDKIRKAFAIFLENTDPSRQWPLLEVALESIRRIDLRDYCNRHRKRE